MNKSLLILAVVLVASAWAEPPQEDHHHHHSHKHSHEAQHGNQHNHHGNHQKIRQSGSSKIFGWLGSRFAKIPHYLPRFPHFPKQHQVPQKLPQYQAIVLPDPPTSVGHNKIRTPDLVKIQKLKHETPSTHYEQVPQYEAVSHHETAPVQQQEELQLSNYAPLPVASYNTFSLPVSNQQIEVVPSTLLYHNNQVIPNGQVASAAVPAPSAAVQSHHHHHQQQQKQYQQQQYQQYSVPIAPAPIAAPPLQYTHNHNTIPAPASKPGLYVQSLKGSTVPVVPQSMGPDYFDTAYRSQEKAQEQHHHHQHHQQQQAALVPQQGFGAENNYGAIFEIPAQPVPQVYDSSAHQAGQHGQPSIQQYANQALNSDSLSSLIASLTDAPANNNHQNSYSGYLQQAASSEQAVQVQQQQQEQHQQQHHQQQQQQQQQQSATQYQQASTHYQQTQQAPQDSKNELPGIKILSQGTDGGNPVFEVVADANAPDFNGHPFDINKLISMIEPGAQLESAELSPAASESKSSYTVPVSSSTTSGIKDLLLSESEPTPSVSKVDGSKVPNSKFPSLNFNANYHANDSSSLKDIVDFFQQTGGKGYVVVEKKRHRPDNLTLDFDQTSDDDLTNGPTRVNITSDMILPHLKHYNASPTSTPDPEQDFDNYYENYDLLAETEPDTQNNLAINSQSKKTEFYSESLNENNEDESSRTLTTSTTTPRSPDWGTPTSQLTTLFEPVTPGKPAIFATTPKPLPSGVTLHPNHNYHFLPLSNSSSLTNSINPGSPLIINPFLDAVEESVLDEPIETEGDLSAAESQQVRSIAITVTPPPKITSTTPRSSKSGKSLATSAAGTGTATTTESLPSTTVISIEPPVTKKTTLSNSAKSRPSPVYRGKNN